MGGIKKSVLGLFKENGRRCTYGHLKIYGSFVKNLKIKKVREYSRFLKESLTLNLLMRNRHIENFLKRLVPEILIKNLHRDRMDLDHFSLSDDCYFPTVSIS